jgi:hypothetical protein
MLRHILAAILPEGSGANAWRRAWMIAIALFPAALVAGFFLLLRTEPRPPVPVTINGAQAVEIARAFALREGIPASSWKGAYGYGLDKPLLDFLNAKPESNRLWSIAPPVYATVTLAQPAGNRSARVYLSVNGQVIGFEWINLPQAGPALPDAEALRLATTRLPSNLPFGKPGVEKKGADRLYTFRSSALPDVDLKALVEVGPNRVVSFRMKAVPDPAPPATTQKSVQSALLTLGIIFVCIVALLSIYRYASRTMQQEVSHRRSLIVAALCGCFCILIAFNAVVNSDAAMIPFAYILAIFAVIGLLGGALLAAAYGSGEGDVREAYPGKLTSLDALLTGRVFSRNIGVSVLFGLVCASWLLLILAILKIPFYGGELRASEGMAGPFMRITWPAPFVTYPLFALAFAAAALLQPLAFLSRYAANRPRRRIPALLVCGALVAMIRPAARSVAELLATSAVFLAALLIPFFLRDLLAALISVATLFVLIGLSSGIAVAPANMTGHAMHVVAGAAIFVFAALSVRYGKTFSEEQVRPLYARHIEERKSLEAEVSAAREAQLRLLPQSAPDFAGVNISAACVPAETVGGDFYDFFNLGDGRLGIFVADGNNHGLAAALTIALAKGYLMHCVEKFREPADILARLETALASIFEGGAGSQPAEFAFAVIDSVACEVRYARTGAYPKVVIASAGGALGTERLVPVKGRTEPIAAGCAPLSAGDYVVLFTDGIGRRLAAAGGQGTPEEIAGTLATRGSRNAEELRERFLAAARSPADPDDLTVVVVQMLARQASVLGVVA